MPRKARRRFFRPPRRRKGIEVKVDNTIPPVEPTDVEPSKNESKTVDCNSPHPENRSALNKLCDTLPTPKSLSRRKQDLTPRTFFKNTVCDKTINSPRLEAVQNLNLASERISGNNAVGDHSYFTQSSETVQNQNLSIDLPSENNSTSLKLCGSQPNPKSLLRHKQHPSPRELIKNTITDTTTLSPCLEQSKNVTSERLDVRDASGCAEIAVSEVFAAVQAIPEEERILDSQPIITAQLDETHTPVNVLTIVPETSVIHNLKNVVAEENQNCHLKIHPLENILLEIRTGSEFPHNPSRVEVVDRATSPIREPWELNPTPTALWQQVRHFIQSSIHSHWQTHIDNDCFYMLMLSRGLNKVVQRSIVVNQDGELSVLVHGKIIPTNHAFWEKTAPSLPSLSTATPFKMSALILIIYKALRDWQTCMGVTDESLWCNHANSFLEEGFQEYRFKKTLRSTNCLYLVPVNSMRCSKCTILRLGLKRKLKMKGDIPLNDNKLDRWLSTQKGKKENAEPQENFTDVEMSANESETDDYISQSSPKSLLNESQDKTVTTENNAPESDDSPNALWTQVKYLVQPSIQSHWQINIENDTFHMIMLSKKSNKVVQRSIIVNLDGELSVLVHDQMIPPNHSFWEKTLASMPSLSTATPKEMTALIVLIYRELRNWQTCVGITDEKYWVEYPNSFLEEGFEEYRFEKTLRSTNCLYLVTRKRCAKCSMLLNGITTKILREKKRKARPLSENPVVQKKRKKKENTTPPEECVM